MPYAVVDVIAPREFMVPHPAPVASQPTISGAMFISGAKLYCVLGAQARLITSAT